MSKDFCHLLVFCFCLWKTLRCLRIGSDVRLSGTSFFLKIEKQQKQVSDSKL